MFKITKSASGMPSIDMLFPSEQEREFLLNVVTDNYFNSIFYKAKQRAQPFIQINTSDQLCIEFWGGPKDIIE